VSDHQLRELEQAFQSSGSPGVEAELIRARLRLARLDLERVRLAASLGHAPAIEAADLEVRLFLRMTHGRHEQEIEEGDREVELVPGQEVVCGRSSTTDFQILQETVSRRHVSATVTGGGRGRWTVIEEHGKTLLNGAPARGSCPLQTGDRVELSEVAVLVVEQRSELPALRVFSPGIGQDHFRQFQICPRPSLKELERLEWIQAHPDEPAPPRTEPETWTEWVEKWPDRELAVRIALAAAHSAFRTWTESKFGPPDADSPDDPDWGAKSVQSVMSWLLAPSEAAYAQITALDRFDPCRPSRELSMAARYSKAYKLGWTLGMAARAAIAGPRAQAGPSSSETDPEAAQPSLLRSLNGASACVGEGVLWETLRSDLVPWLLGHHDPVRRQVERWT
jgi:hypothetical protein